MRLLVITPGREAIRDSVFYLMDAETGEVLAQHVCSHYGFAYGDLYRNRPEFVKELDERFGEVEVKFLEDTAISESELLFRNHSFYGEEV